MLFKKLFEMNYSHQMELEEPPESGNTNPVRDFGQPFGKSTELQKLADEKMFKTIQVSNSLSQKMQFLNKSSNDNPLKHRTKL